MSYIVHTGDPKANDAVTLSQRRLQEFLELVGYAFDPRGGEFDATDFFSRCMTAGFELWAESKNWERALDLQDMAQNAPSGRVFYCPKK